MNGKILLTILLSLGCASNAYASVSLTISGLKANVKNGLVELDFRADSTISAVKVGGKNIASTNEKSFYLDWNNNGQGFFSPLSIHVVEQTSSRVHFYWLQENIANVFRIELHYIMVDGICGIYSYTKYTNDKSYDLTLGETRIVYRFNPSILSQGSNQARQGTLYTADYLNKQTKIQDETWQLPDGTYYTKYDYAGYLRETNYQGVYGNGYGAFLISPSREYHGGGPLKQDLLIHQNSLITNYFVSSHFGTAGLTASPGWSHIYGPWLMYFNTGSDSSILSDVVNRVGTEQWSWPYNFVNEADYPLTRGSVSGTVSGQTNAMVVVWDDTTQTLFEEQCLGYLYNTKTNSDGSYSISNIRPGNYKVAAYPLAGQGSENLATASVTVTAGGYAWVDTLYLPEPSNIMWSIGETDRKSDQYKYSNEPRNYVYETLPPETLTFTIGSSSISNDWYYAQSKPGVWTIQYQDSQDGNGRTLRIALAAASVNPHLIVYLNGHKIGDVYCENDHAVYRSAMQSGTFSSFVFTANNAQVASGTNTLTLQISKGMVMYDAISLQRG